VGSDSSARRGWAHFREPAEALYDLDQFFGAVAVSAGEVDEVEGAGDDRAPSRRAAEAAAHGPLATRCA
jgi:hypothetical protein